jgi:potassium channel subfamily K, other eukaryote
MVPLLSAWLTEDGISDRLLAVNAVQLVLAVVSNIFLLLNMARRVRFSIAQPITIAGW